MAMASLGADHSGFSKRVCLSVCTKTGLSQAQGKGGTWAPGETLSALADDHLPKTPGAAEGWAGAALAGPKASVVRTQRSRWPRRRHQPCASEPAWPCSFITLIELCKPWAVRAGFMPLVFALGTLHGCWVMGRALLTMALVGPGAPLASPGWFLQGYSCCRAWGTRKRLPQGTDFGCSGWKPSNAHPVLLRSGMTAKGGPQGAPARQGCGFLSWLVIAALPQMSRAKRQALVGGHSTKWSCSLSPPQGEVGAECGAALVHADVMLQHFPWVFPASPMAPSGPSLAVCPGLACWGTFQPRSRWPCLPSRASPCCPRCLECFLQALTVEPSRGCHPLGALESSMVCPRGGSEVCTQGQSSQWTSWQAAAPNCLSFIPGWCRATSEWQLQHWPCVGMGREPALFYTLL